MGLKLSLWDLIQRFPGVGPKLSVWDLVQRIPGVGPTLFVWDFVQWFPGVGPTDVESLGSLLPSLLSLHQICQEHLGP